jgi:hypothetical protein
VEDREKMIVVLIDLRSLVTAEDVLVSERVEVETLLKPTAISCARALNIDPAEPVQFELLYVKTLRLLSRDYRAVDTTCATEAWLWKAGHPD